MWTQTLEGCFRELRNEVDENTVAERIFQAVQLLSTRQETREAALWALKDTEAALWALKEQAKDKSELTEAFSQHFGTLLLDADKEVQNSKGILDLETSLEMPTWSAKELATLRGYMTKVHDIEQKRPQKVWSVSHQSIYNNDSLVLIANIL